MVEIFINEQHIQEAKELYKFNVLNNSITEGKGNKTGALGEVIARQYLNAKQENTYDYDIVFKDKKIDVKTKRYEPQYKPTTQWNLNIPDFNTSQQCDYYLFIGMSGNHKVAYFYGFIEKNKFYKIARFHEKGKLDPTSPFPFRFTADCYNILISELETDIGKI